MRFTRRRLFATIGLALAAAAGCGPSKDDRPNPELGPPPNNGPPPRRTEAPAPVKP